MIRKSARGKIYLQSQGYEVFQASDGVEGLEVLGKEEINRRKNHKGRLFGSVSKSHQKILTITPGSSVCILYFP